MQTNNGNYSDNWDRIFDLERRKKDLEELVKLSQEMGFYDLPPSKTESLILKSSEK